MVNIQGIPKALLLQTLYNRSQQQGMGFLDPTGRLNMTLSEAEGIIANRTNDQGRIAYFDYLYGRVIKCDLNGDTMNEALFDRDMGEGAAAAVISGLRASLGLPS